MPLQAAANLATVVHPAAAQSAGTSVAPVATASQPPPAGSQVQPAVSVAHNAVDAVLKLVDAQAVRAQAPASSVNLNFKVGSDNLAVRVEWREGQVSAQFSTNSTELRSALATELQSLAASPAGQSLHLTSSVVASGGGGADDSSLASNGRGQQADSEAQPQLSQDARFSPAASGVASQAAASAPTAPDESPPLSAALHLRTFA